jgi:zinc protease
VFVAKDARGLADALASDLASPITYNTEKPAELTEEDKLIAVRPFMLPRERIEVIKAETMFE